MVLNGTSNLSALLTSLDRGWDMFSTKKFGISGKSRQKISPSQTPPEPRLTESMHSSINNCSQGTDFTRFDFMGIEEFLSTLTDQSKNDNLTAWRASNALANQLRGSRALLSLRSYLSTDGTVSPFDRLVEMAYQILNAENFYLLQLDTDGTNLVVTHTRAVSAIGMKVSVGEISTGTSMNNIFYLLHLI